MSTLIGRTPGEVRDTLAGMRLDWPVTYAVELKESGKRVSVVRVSDLLGDAAATEIMTRGRNHATDRLPTVWEQCRTKFADDASARDADDAYLGRLIFEDGRLARLLTSSTPRVLRAWPGPGSLSQGVAALDGWGSAVAPSRRLTTACIRETAAPAPVRARSPDRSWNPQDLAGLPFVPLMPFLNAHRLAAREAGTALYERLSPGTRFVIADLRKQDGGAYVRIIETPEAGYDILRIDMGAYAGRNTSDEDDYGLVGLRDGVVAWRALTPELSGIVLTKSDQPLFIPPSARPSSARANECRSRR